MSPVPLSGARAAANSPGDAWPRRSASAMTWATASGSSRERSRSAAVRWGLVTQEAAPAGPLAVVQGAHVDPHVRASSGASTSPITLAEHRVEFGVGPDRADFLRAAAGDGDLGRPFQRLLA